jgi:hypothetical protein
LTGVPGFAQAREDVEDVLVLGDPETVRVIEIFAVQPQVSFPGGQNKVAATIDRLKSGRSMM